MQLSDAGGFRGCGAQWRGRDSSKCLGRGGFSYLASERCGWKPAHHCHHVVSGLVDRNEVGPRHGVEERTGDARADDDDWVKNDLRPDQQLSLRVRESRGRRAADRTESFEERA